MEKKIADLYIFVVIKLESFLCSPLVGWPMSLLFMRFTFPWQCLVMTFKCGFDNSHKTREQKSTHSSQRTNTTAVDDVDLLNF